MQAKKQPNTQALITEDKAYTFSELESLVDRACNFFQTWMPKRQTDILILKAPLHLHTVVLYLACIRCHLLPCLIHPKEPQEKVAQLLNDLKTPYLLDPLDVQFPEERSKIEALFSSHTPICLMLTSGTSGKPKYAGLSLHNFYYSFLGIKPVIQLSSTSRYLLNLPLNHVSGLAIVFRALFGGFRLIMQQNAAPLSSLILQEKITHLSLVSLQLRRLLEEKQLTDFPSLKCVLLGGGPTALSTIRQALEKKLPVFQSYGMTEAASTITCKKLSLDQKISCGLPLRFRALQLQNDGEICIWGKILFLGYFDTNIMQTVPIKKLFTKDVGMFAEDAELILLGRKDHRVIIKGEKIDPEEIENALSAHENIEKACVVAVDKVQSEPELVAFVSTQNNSIPEQIEIFLQDKLPSFKQPKKYFLWPCYLQVHSSKIPSSLRKTLYDLALSSILKSS